MKYELNCSFCGAAPSSELVTFFPGPGVSICGACVGAALQTILDGRSAWAASKQADAESKGACCSFCRKPASKVKWMHNRNDRQICNKCLVFCVDIALADKKPLPFVASQ